MSAPYGYPSWNYGYTLCPETGSQYYQPPVVPVVGNGFLPRGRGSGRGQPFIRGAPQGGPVYPGYQKPVKNEAKTETGAQPVTNLESKVAAPVKPAVVKDEQEEGEIVEKPLEEILRGRNAIMFCNDQTKIRKLRMEWEQVSETGPPHSKIFTWSLKIGEHTTLGSANNKKGAKNKAAEEMARKLDKLPKVRASFNNQRGGGGYQPSYPPQGYYPAGPTPIPQFVPIGPIDPAAVPYGQVQYPWPAGGPAKKRKFTENGSSYGPSAKNATPLTPAEIAAKLNQQSINNPISKLYEYCKHSKLPEPIFELTAENVLEKKLTNKGFVLKKTEFTIQVEVQGKKFVGSATTKKQAKLHASEAAWAEFGGGVAPASIDSLLQGSRDASK